MVSNCLDVHFEEELYSIEANHLVWDMERFTCHYVVRFLSEC